MKSKGAKEIIYGILLSFNYDEPRRPRRPRRGFLCGGSMAKNKNAGNLFSPPFLREAMKREYIGNIIFMRLGVNSRSCVFL
jgi:hypothetical protein